MSDLTDDELRSRLKWAMGERHLEPFVEPLRELQNMRAAKRESEGRIRGMMLDAIDDAINGYASADSIATRVASQLASAAPVLSAEEREVLTTMRAHCRDLRGSERDVIDRLLGASR